jgi:hypothetical protein
MAARETPYAAKPEVKSERIVVLLLGNRRLDCHRGYPVATAVWKTTGHGLGYLHPADPGWIQRLGGQMMLIMMVGGESP